MSLLNNHYLSSINLFFSSDRADIDHSSSRKTFYLKKPINVPKNSHLMLALNSFNSPYSFYLIREGVNDSFTISTDNGVTVVEQVITIPEGNYSLTELIPAINTLFTSYSVALRTTITLFYNYTTSKFYMTSSVVMNEVKMYDINCHKILGYEEESTYVYISASTWTAPYIADISGSSCLYVAVKHRGIQNQNMAGVDGVLQKINIEVLPLEYIYFKPIEMQYFETSSEHINHFDISILDENFKEIEFNGGIWRIGFTIHYNYNKEVILDDSLKELLPKEIDEEKKIKELEERKKELEEEKKELVKKKQTKEKKTKNKKNS